ncbi:MAG: hypothetical protein GXN99_01810, partial [Candidatus Nanohaloarchaeota archaeon]|nr:hypothetical protein [Candidatus Nanohaloarchaeota archaeon]
MYWNRGLSGMLDVIANIAQMFIAVANLVMIGVLIEQNSPQLIIRFHSRDDDVERSNRINIKNVGYLTIINVSKHKIAENITVEIHLKPKNKGIKEYKAQLDPIPFLNPYEAVKIPISLEEF